MVPWCSGISNEAAGNILPLHKGGKFLNIHQIYVNFVILMLVYDRIYELILAYHPIVVQGKLEKKYSIELKNAGVADVAIRNDSKIFASGGWDGRYGLYTMFIAERLSTRH